MVILWSAWLPPNMMISIRTPMKSPLQICCTLIYLIKISQIEAAVDKRVFKSARRWRYLKSVGIDHRPSAVYCDNFQQFTQKIDLPENIVDSKIQTADLWCLKRPLCQLSHNHCPTPSYLILVANTTNLIRQCTNETTILRQYCKTFRPLCKWSYLIQSHLNFFFFTFGSNRG